MTPMDNDDLIFPHQSIIPIPYTLLQLSSPFSQGALTQSTPCLFASTTSYFPPISVHNEVHPTSPHVSM
jgi:hypothetical protein